VERSGIILIKGAADLITRALLADSASYK